MRVCARVLVAGFAACQLGLAGTRDASAQTWFELGIKGGLALTNLSNGASLGGSAVLDEPTDTGGYVQGLIAYGLGDQKPGFVGGVYATAHMNPHFGIRLEALYANKGTQGKNSGSVDVYDATSTLLGSYDVSGDNTLTLAYFEIPILALVSFPSGPHGEFDVFAGPALAFRTKAEMHSKVTLSYYGQSQSASATQDLGDSAADTDVGGVLGIGYSHRAGGVILSGDARWTQGFSTIDNAGFDTKNRAFSLSLGLGLPIGGAP